MSLIAIHRTRARVQARDPTRCVLCSTADKVYNVVTDRKAEMGDVPRVCWLSDKAPDAAILSATR